MSDVPEILADAVIFDMDGTLVDSTALVEIVWAAFADRHGVDLAELLDYAHGRRAADTVEHFLRPSAAAPGESGAPATGVAPSEGLAPRQGGVPSEIVAPGQGAVPGADGAPRGGGAGSASARPVDVAEALAVVSEHETGVEGAVVEIPGAAAFVAAFDPGDVALVTSAPQELARLRMAEVGIPLPAVVVTAEDVAVGKPDPEGYLRAAQLVGRDPARVVIFEDADAGLSAARASGAQVVVVGDHAGPAADGLVRIRDYRSTTVTRTPDGAYRIEFPGP